MLNHANIKNPNITSIGIFSLKFWVLSAVKSSIRFGKNTVSEIEKYATIRAQFENVKEIGCKNAAKKTNLK